MKQSYAILVVVVGVVGYGVAEGYWSNRWGFSKELEKAAAKVKRIPKKFGPWQGKMQDINTRHVAVAEIEKYFNCLYRNEATGEQISALVVCGKPGPTCSHTPEACFPGAGLHLEVPPQEVGVQIDGFSQGAKFLAGRFRKNSALGPTDIEVYWSWNADGDWKTPYWPMWTFASSPALYKMYIIRVLPPTSSEDDREPTEDFLKKFLPEVQKALFSKEGEKLDS
ncbi:MAG: hypothetical protein ACFCD0_04740 [Gemmataceae bacterium]